MILQAECLEAMRDMPAASVALVLWSPPYHGKTNRYGTKIKMSAQEWASWQADCVQEAVRVSAGSVVVIANGCVRDKRYEPSCERLIVECDDRGIRCERPVIWHKNAPPNRKDWFGNDWEYCMSFGRSPVWNWRAIGTAPKHESGGDFRQRNAAGQRRAGGAYPKNKITRPRDVLRVTVGGGHLGSPLAHENEAPFPEKLVEPFILALTNAGDTVLDCFCGSGTTIAVAQRLGRRSIGIDIRASQVELTARRLGAS